MKNIIICGKGRSGKTFLANNIAVAFENVEFLNGRNQPQSDSFIFDRITKKTDLIHFDDVKLCDLKIIVKLFISDVMLINRKAFEPIYVNTPPVLVTIDESADKIIKKFRSYGIEILNYCKIIETRIEEYGDKKVRFHQEEIKPLTEGKK